MLYCNAIGNLVREPEKTEKGARIVLACNNNRDIVDYVNVYLYGKMAENALQYLTKGNKVAVNGAFHCEIRETDDNVYLNEYMNASYIEYLYTGNKEKEDNKENNKKRVYR